MRLSREQRAELFAGEHPRIAFSADKPCPVEVGYVHELSSRLHITIKGIGRTKQGEWLLSYEIRDERPRLLRRTPHDTSFDEIRRGFDEHGFPQPPTAERIKQAAEESAYTTSDRQALTEAGEAVPPEYQKGLTAQAKDRFAEHRAEVASDEERRRQERALRDQLRFALQSLSVPAQAALLAKIQRDIEEAQRMERAA